MALASAQELDEKETWHKLGVEALRQGNHHIVEFAYQKTKNFERLSFLYLITGNVEKLAKMLKIAEMRSDVMGQFHNALYTGDVRERCKILEQAGHYPLAYLTAATHGLADDANRLAQVLTDSGVPVPAVDPAEGKLLTLPTPLVREDNWPLLTVTKGFFEGVLAGDVAASDYASFADEDLEGAGAGWGDDLDLDLGGDEKPGDAAEDPLAAAGLAPEEKEAGEGSDDGSDAGWDMEDLELPPAAEGADGDAMDDAVSEVFVAPTAGVPAARKWTQKSKPRLYAIKSKADPSKTVWQQLQGPNPHETGPRKIIKEEISYEPVLTVIMGDEHDGIPVKDARGNGIHSLGPQERLTRTPASLGYGSSS